tara:strand:- start:229 stop:453 length:225 start_codon:yes stop_codon:yes gene_type:complete
LNELIARGFKSSISIKKRILDFHIIRGGVNNVCASESKDETGNVNASSKQRRGDADELRISEPPRQRSALLEMC